MMGHGIMANPTCTQFLELKINCTYWYVSSFQSIMSCVYFQSKDNCNFLTYAAIAPPFVPLSYSSTSLH